MTYDTFLWNFQDRRWLSDAYRSNIFSAAHEAIKTAGELQQLLTIPCAEFRIELAANANLPNHVVEALLHTKQHAFGINQPERTIANLNILYQRTNSDLPELFQALLQQIKRKEDIVGFFSETNWPKLPWSIQAQIGDVLCNFRYPIHLVSHPLRYLARDPNTRRIACSFLDYSSDRSIHQTAFHLGVILGKDRPRAHLPGIEHLHHLAHWDPKTPCPLDAQTLHLILKWAPNIDLKRWGITPKLIKQAQNMPQYDIWDGASHTDCGHSFRFTNHILWLDNTNYYANPRPIAFRNNQNQIFLLEFQNQRELRNAKHYLRRTGHTIAGTLQFGHLYRATLTPNPPFSYDAICAQIIALLWTLPRSNDIASKLDNLRDAIPAFQHQPGPLTCQNLDRILTAASLETLLHLNNPMQDATRSSLLNHWKTLFRTTQTFLTTPPPTELLAQII